MTHLFFDNWMVVLRTCIIGVVAYFGLIAFLRISGKRTLSKMNAFDLLVTVALGSSLANIILSKDVSLLQGLLAFALLIGLQYLVTWSSVRTTWVRKVITGEPVLLFHRGKCLPEALRQSRVTEEEVKAAIRGAGHGAMETVEAVVLETDGSFSVVKQSGEAEHSSLAGVGWPTPPPA